MTLDELNMKAQDNLLDVMQTIKIFKEEIVSLNNKINTLQAQIDELTSNAVGVDND